MVPVADSQSLYSDKGVVQHVRVSSYQVKHIEISHEALV
jgi:hypothetical protein